MQTHNPMLNDALLVAILDFPKPGMLCLYLRVLSPWLFSSVISVYHHQFISSISVLSKTLCDIVCQILVIDMWCLRIIIHPLHIKLTHNITGILFSNLIWFEYCNLIGWSACRNFWVRIVMSPTYSFANDKFTWNNRN